MYRIFLLSAYLLFTGSIHGQIFFDILPDVGGINGQAMSFIAIPDSNSLKIIGHRYDTILPGANTKPWLGEFDYNGELIKVLPLIDSNYTTPFNVFNNPLAHKSGSIYYYYARRDTGGVYIIPDLIELNITSGEIYRSKLITIEQYPNLPLIGTFVNFDKLSKKIILLNSLYKNDSVITNITLLDTLLNLHRAIRIQSMTREAYGHWCKLNNDNTISIIGFALKNQTGDDYFNFYLQKVDSTGNNIEFRWAPTEVPLFLGIANTRTIIQDISQNWIISGLYAQEGSCQNCYQHIPYIFSASLNFDTLLWQTRFYDLPDQNQTKYHLHSMSQVADGYVVAADHLASDESPFPPSGVLFKVSFNGDSIWMKHYIPLNWNEERVAWVNFNDVKVTQSGNLIIAGSIGDLDLKIIRPWILHLDSEGCLVPGCNTVSLEDPETEADDNIFLLYPNPANEELYLSSAITSTEEVNIKIVTVDGIIIRSTNFLPHSGYQYILSLTHFSPGTYHIIFSNERNHLLESHTFLKQ